jgi:rare lipoprotein A (peptidoglycan hydrolase)
LRKITTLAVLCLATILLVWLLSQTSYLFGREIKKIQVSKDKPAVFKLTESAEVREWQSLASWYGSEFQGKRRADGKLYNMYKISVAHKFLPLGTRLKITTLNNYKIIWAKVLDRGPYKKGRDIDLSYKAAKMLGALKPGLIPVKIRVIS